MTIDKKFYTYEAPTSPSAFRMPEWVKINLDKLQVQMKDGVYYIGTVKEVVRKANELVPYGICLTGTCVKDNKSPRQYFLLTSNIASLLTWSNELVNPNLASEIAPSSNFSLQSPMPSSFTPSSVTKDVRRTAYDVSQFTCDMLLV